MTDDDLADRVAAVERRLDAAYPEEPERVGRERVEAMADRLADLEAAVEAIEGYVGEVERVDDDLERRADAALAAADDLEARVDALEAAVGEWTDPPGRPAAEALGGEGRPTADSATDAGPAPDGARATSDPDRATTAAPGARCDAEGSDGTAAGVAGPDAGVDANDAADRSRRFRVDACECGRRARSTGSGGAAPAVEPSREWGTDVGPLATTAAPPDHDGPAASEQPSEADGPSETSSLESEYGNATAPESERSDVDLGGETPVSGWGEGAPSESGHTGGPSDPARARIGDVQHDRPSVAHGQGTPAQSDVVTDGDVPAPDGTLPSDRWADDVPSNRRSTDGALDEGPPANAAHVDGATGAAPDGEDEPGQTLFERLRELL